MIVLLISVFLLGLVLDNIDSNILFRNLDKSYLEEKHALRSELAYVLNSRGVRDYFIDIIEERESGKIPTPIKTYRYDSVLNKNIVNVKVIDYRRNILKARINYRSSKNNLIVTFSPINPTLYKTKGRIILRDLSGEELIYLEDFIDEIRETGTIAINNYYEGMPESHREGLIYIDENIDEEALFKGIIILSHDMEGVDNFWDRNFISKLRNLSTFYGFNKMSYILDIRL